MYNKKQLDVINTPDFQPIRAKLEQIYDLINRYNEDENKDEHHDKLARLLNQCTAPVFHVILKSIDDEQQKLAIALDASHYRTPIQPLIGTAPCLHNYEYTQAAVNAFSTAQAKLDFLLHAVPSNHDTVLHHITDDTNPLDLAPPKLVRILSCLETDAQRYQLITTQNDSGQSFLDLALANFSWIRAIFPTFTQSTSRANLLKYQDKQQQSFMISVANSFGIATLATLFNLINDEDQLIVLLLEQHLVVETLVKHRDALSQLLACFNNRNNQITLLLAKNNQRKTLLQLSLEASSSQESVASQFSSWNSDGALLPNLVSEPECIKLIMQRCATDFDRLVLINKRNQQGELLLVEALLHNQTMLFMVLATFDSDDAKFAALKETDGQGESVLSLIIKSGNQSLQDSLCYAFNSPKHIQTYISAMLAIQTALRATEGIYGFFTQCCNPGIRKELSILAQLLQTRDTEKTLKYTLINYLRNEENYLPNQKTLLYALLPTHTHPDDYDTDVNSLESYWNKLEPKPVAVQAASIRKRIAFPTSLRFDN